MARDTSCGVEDGDDTDDGNSSYKGVADDDDDDEPQHEGFLSRVARIAAPSRMLRRGEVAGALGDLGTFLPDVVALSKGGVTLLPEPAAMVFFSGLWSAWAGVLFDLPMPIQPMHAVVAVALTEGLSYPQMVASTVWLGGAFLVLGSLGLISWCQRVIPLSVVRGLQLGLGLKVFATGVTLALTSCKEWRTSTESALELGLLVISAALAALLYGDRLRPASLVLFVLGLHLFGARTGSSMMLMGFVKMALALALGPSLATVLAAFPNAVLGVLLALSGVELAISCRDMSEKRDTAVMLIGAGLVLRAGTGPAFVVSLLAAAGLKRS